MCVCVCVCVCIYTAPDKFYLILFIVLSSIPGGLYLFYTTTHFLLEAKSKNQSDITL